MKTPRLAPSLHPPPPPTSPRARAPSRGGSRRRSRPPVAALLAGLALAAAPAEPAVSPASPPAGLAAQELDLSRWELVDLTHAFDSTTVYWPTAPSGFRLEVLNEGETEGGWWYEANAYAAPEHGGTHLDAPVHFHRGGWDAAEIPLERLVGPAAVIDVSERAAGDPDYVLTPDDVRAWEETHGPVPEGALVLLRTGWSDRWPDRRRYLGDDTPGDASNLHFPAYGEAAARLLVEERGVAALGADVASIDPGRSADFPVHRIAGAANVAGLENLTNLGALPPTGAVVFALPMKIASGSGGPLRAVALVPRAGGGDAGGDAEGDGGADGAGDGGADGAGRAGRE